MNKMHDYVDQDGIHRALQYRYTYWPQPENATMMRQKIVDVSQYGPNHTTQTPVTSLHLKIICLKFK